jgi:hypothetical protein
MSKLVTIPDCRGTFEIGHPQCDGDERSTDADDKAPCAFRDRCRALEIYVARAAPEVTDDAIDRVLGPLSDEELISTADLIVDEEGIEGGRLPSERPREARSRKAKRRRRKSKRAPYPEELIALYQHFRRALRDVFGEWSFSEGQQIIASPGTIYEGNRLATSDYISFYCTSESGPHHAIASLRFRPGGPALDVELPVTPITLEAVLSAAKWRQLDVRDLSRGQFKSVVKGVSSDATLGLIAETLRKLVEQGRLKVTRA